VRVNTSSGWRAAVVADEWELVRLGVEAAVGPFVGRVWAAGARASQALRLVRERGADLLVAGSLSDLTLSETVRRAGRLPQPPCVVALVAQADRAELAGLVAAGADGLLLRSVGAGELRAALARLRAGERVVAAGLVPSLVGAVDPAGGEAWRAAGAAAGPAGEGPDRGATLTAKEREVLARLAEGRSNRAIAAVLHVTPATVKTHLAHIYGKLGARDRNEALVKAVSLGLLG